MFCKLKVISGGSSVKILGMDTSSSIASVAVLDNDSFLGEYSINHKRTHSQKLMPMMNELFDSLELKPLDIDAFAVSIGPGSFTGLRIGISTIKGMAQALGKPVIGVPTLEGLAYNVLAYEGCICPIIDARNDNVYTAIFSYDKNKKILQRHSDYMALHIQELIAKLEKEQQIIFLGDAAQKFEHTIKEKLENRAEFAGNHLSLPKASSIAYAGFKSLEEGQVDSFISIKPLYIRSSQAERMYKQP
jgi:tRNA threonylcarbamoyladenosine biosynthesis protein TsaB